MALNFYKCSEGGEIVISPDADETLSCHGVPMVRLVADDTDAALEKHVPDVSVEGNIVRVQVGSVAHPMLEEHHIVLIALECAKTYQVAWLTPGQEPTATFAVAPGDYPVAVYEYCNLHSLWKFTI